MTKLTLETLKELLASHSIEEAYGYFGYDYMSESNRSNTFRQKFLDLFSWRTKPESEVVRRLFNQMNTYYAERWALDNAQCAPATLLPELNKLTLFRQGKRLGPRAARITYGLRVHLDFQDPFRQWPWLYGAAPGFVDQALKEWCQTVENCKASLDAAICLSMFLIAIHPFSDANGRVARLSFTWLCQRWGFPLLWLGEAADGELLRTGIGIQSTEYLMGLLMIRLASGKNIVDPGDDMGRPRESDLAMLQSLLREFAQLRSGDLTLLTAREFTDLKSHLESEGHFRPSSPRFECLKDALF